MTIDSIILKPPKYNKGKPINKEVFLKNLKRCHASVVKTNIVDDPGNFSVFKSSFHLFFQDSFGFQNNLFFLSEKIDLSKWKLILSIIASDIAENPTNIRLIINSIILFQIFF